MIELIDVLSVVVTFAAGGYIAVRFPDREGLPDDEWTRTDLTKVPYVIAQPEPRGELLPWYRRVFRRASVATDTAPELTTYRS